MKVDLQKIIEILMAIQNRLLLGLPVRKRLVPIETMLEKRAMILVGPRGTGKSTFLLELSTKLKGKSFYVSLDNPLVVDFSLFELGNWVFQNGYDNFVCDEVHYYQDWSIHLKSLYDSFPNKQIWASDSSTLILKKGVADLSRRFLIREFSYLSFREYLWLKHGLELPSISYHDLLKSNLGNISHELNRMAKAQDFNLQDEFKQYLNSGIRPFFLEGDYEERIRSIVDKIIHSDIPHFLPEIRETHLNLMRNIIGYLATSPIPVVNVDSLSKTWSVGKLTVYNLLAMMEDTSLINIIRYEGIKKGQSRGAKIFFSDPSLYFAYSGLLGNVRESYFCMQMRMMHKNPCCPKEDNQYDFSINEHTFEIGGRSKKIKGANWVVRDDVDIATNNVIPLWMLGFLDRTES